MFVFSLEVFGGGLLQPPVRMIPQPQPVRRIEPPRFPSRNDRGPELILRTKEERRCEGARSSLYFIIWNFSTISISLLHITSLAETETVNAGDRENVHPHVNAQETARQDGIAHQDGPAGWFPVTQSSSLSSASMGESLSVISWHKQMFG